MNKKRILVVDDEIGFTRLLKLNLEQTNDYDVRIENRPAHALNAAREFGPDLVLLDVLMPGMFGADVAVGLRADARFKSTPIVFITAAVSKTRVKENDGLISGFPFLAKPSSVEEVIEQIEQRLAALRPIAERNGAAGRANVLLPDLPRNDSRRDLYDLREAVC